MKNTQFTQCTLYMTLHRINSLYRSFLLDSTKTETKVVKSQLQQLQVYGCFWTHTLWNCGGLTNELGC